MFDRAKKNEIGSSSVLDDSKRVKLGTTIAPRTMQAIELEQRCSFMCPTQGYAIDYLISLLNDLKPEDKSLIRDLVDEQKNKISELLSNLEANEGDCHEQIRALKDRNAALERLWRYLNVNHNFGWSDNSFIKEPAVKRVDFKGGYLICPSDYLIATPDWIWDKDFEVYPYVFEMWNGYKVNAPHIIVWRDKNNTFSAIEEEEFINQCATVWPDIEKYENKVIDAIWANGRILNKEAWENGFAFGFFPAQEARDFTPGRIDYKEAIVYRNGQVWDETEKMVIKTLEQQPNHVFTLDEIQDVIKCAKRTAESICITLVSCDVAEKVGDGYKAKA